jgi:hypothetical protein
MKKVKLLIMIVCISVVSISSSASIAWAADDVCSDAPVMVVYEYSFGAVKNRLNTYNEIGGLLTADESAYCLVFEMDEGEALEVASQLTLTKKDDKDVHIVGFKINSIMNDAPLSITHDGGEGTVYLRNAEITNVRDGLALASSGTPAAGAIQVVDSTITGAAKEGNCITVAAPGTILSGVTVSNCAEGVQVNANNVQITNSLNDPSRIFTNKIGVHLTNGFTGINFNHSLIYANDDEDDDTLARFDGVLLDQGVISDLRFFELVDDEPIYCEADEETCVFDNENRMARILLPEDHGYDGRVELYMATKLDCGMEIKALGQPCKIVEELSTDISLEVLVEGEGVQTELPASYMDKELVAIYTSTESGSTAISQKFKIAGGEELSGGVVAFVQTPYDIPTPAGGVDDSAELGSSGGDDETDVIGGSGSGMDAASGSSGMKCSLVEGQLPNAMAFGLELWWIIFGIALLGSTRLTTARIKR